MHSAEIEKLVMLHLMAFPQFAKERTARLNKNFTPPATGIWIRPTVLGGVNFIKGMADKPCTREVGTVIVQVFDRVNTGTGNIKAYTDALAKHLSYHKQDRLELLAASIVNVGDSGSDFYQINVSVPYRYN